LGVHPSAGILGVGVFALGTNLIGKILPLAKSGFLDWSILFRMIIYGNPRYTPFLIKYMESNAMPAGLSLFCALAFFCVLLCRKKSSSLLLISPVILASIGLVYPSIFPPAVALVVCLIVILFISDGDALRYSTREILCLSLGILLAVLIGFVYLRLLTSGRAGSATDLAPLSGMLRRVSYAGMVFAPLAIPALWPAWQALRKKSRTLLILLAGTVAAIAMNAVFRLENGVEYKFILCAAITLAPLTAAGLDPLTSRWRRLRWVLALLVPMLLAPFMISTSVAYIPWELSDVPRVDESSFQISFAPSHSQAVWTRALYGLTPEDTVLVVHEPDFVYSAYTGRSLYVVQSPDTVVGYGLPIEENLLDIRGYSADIYTRRLQLVEHLYTGCNPVELSLSLDELKKMRRPIALYFYKDQGSGLRAFLVENGIGSKLVANGVHVVWYIKPEIRGGGDCL
jgi:hypothetical protein